MTTVKLDTKKMDALLRALGKNMPSVQVGILGEEPRAEGGKATNAFIGACHEFGTARLPMRSFLRVPITDHLQKKMQNAGYKRVFSEIAEGESLVPLAKKIGVMAEAIVLEGFATGGYGKWKSHAPGYENNTGNILVDTTQLRDSITSEVKE